MPSLQPFPHSRLPSLSHRAERSGRTKKLIGAARAWAFARSGRIDPEQPAAVDQAIADEFTALGVLVPEAEAAGSATFAVMEENWRAVMAFNGLSTQWRVVVGTAGFNWLGLDYAAAAAAHKGRNRASWRRLLDDLKVMEDAALPILNGV